MSDEFKKVESLVDQLKAYLNTRLSQVKLSMAEHTSKVVAIVIAAVMVALVFFLSLLLLCVAAALLIGQWLHSMWLGFVIVSSVVLLIGLVLWIAKDRLFGKPIINAMLNSLSEKEDNEKE